MVLLKRVLLSTCLLVFSPEVTLSGPITPDMAPKGFADIVAPLLPAVVNISTENSVSAEFPGRDLFDSPMGPNAMVDDIFRDFIEQLQPEGPSSSNSVGSGFIIDPAGYIVTNNHLVEDATIIKVTLNDNTELEAKLVGRDPRTDIALLKVEASRKLPAVEWGDVGQLRTGDWIIAIGNPFGLGGSVTSGIVSHLGRNINQHQNQGPQAGYGDFVGGYIQTDASINLGNSGGPMFDMRGRVVGVNRAIYSMNGGNIGISFAIPESIAKKVVAQLRQYGRTKRGWIGVQIRSVSEDIAESLGLKKPEGAMVANILPGSPSDKAGLKMGDVITKLDSTPITEFSNLPRMIADLPVGSTVPMAVWRRGKIVNLKVKIEEFEKAQDQGLVASPTQKNVMSKGTFVEGIELQTLTEEIKKSFALKSTLVGVLVTQVDPRSEASAKGIRPGDIITEVSQEPVKTPEEVIKFIDQAKKLGRKSVLLLVSRDGEARYVALKITAPAPIEKAS